MNYIMQSASDYFPHAIGFFLSSATMDSICIYRTVCNTTEIPHTCKASMSFLDGKFPAHI